MVVVNNNKIYLLIFKSLLINKFNTIKFIKFIVISLNIAGNIGIKSAILNHQLKNVKPTINNPKSKSASVSL